MSLTEFPHRSSGERPTVKAPSRPVTPPIEWRTDYFNWPPTVEEERLIEVIDLGSSEPTSHAGFVALVERAPDPPPRVLRLVPPMPIHTRPPVQRRRGTLAWLSPIAAGLFAMHLVESRLAPSEVSAPVSTAVSAVAEAASRPAEPESQPEAQPVAPAPERLRPRPAARAEEPEPIPQPVKHVAFVRSPRPAPLEPEPEPALAADPPVAGRFTSAIDVTAPIERFTPPVAPTRRTVERGPAPFPAARNSRTRIEVMVDASGRVESARLLSPGTSYFDERALESVRAWRFEPARRGDRPVRAPLQVEVASH